MVNGGINPESAIDNQQSNSLLLDQCKVLREKTEQIHIKLTKRFEKAVEN